MNILNEFSSKYGGKVSATNRGTGGQNTGGDASECGYTDVYIKLFDEIRNDEINFLEIGIFQGRSLAMWSDYFSNGNIYGIDINITEFDIMKPKLESMGAFKNGNLCDVIQGSSLDIKTRGDNDEPYFHIIIDDGAHSYKAQVETFNNFYPLLMEGGTYVIEDTEYTAEKLLENIPIARCVTCHRNTKLVIINKDSK